ncbi:MAG: hypothetical protein US86_C0001G0034 [Candidatus Daviesbacteria bacterium GW2011_GWA2_38_24]|uniref:Uncharacterized protein n=1 Tax=Candidatus Daviesbacteria bacterium GW2011_GWA2_38_24 TaxID=1618422 RepID=A0A0G0JJX1_9BACT|nr:MAG: hypothetical protein US86_C0001G0034 [Candidatus Daviesbacteria bacterium GW2011_GWA2_38_24]KKQ80139.1 MAG: hypothetical protein UT01_C0018G0004 [Candidatus Daviesbacteria bacterium GW2011_GWA1_38_7]OGE22783.1 MAG: hypothetical protein A2688_00825 [Candidatus Daviesbacteria bacterium RIFCSPHIGHO2_01_FULL_38_8]
MNNNTPGQVTKITEKIMEIAESKDINYNKINKKPICDEAKTSCVSGKEYKGASCDFWNRSCESI